MAAFVDVVAKTGALTTVAITPNQVVLTYTVPAGRTLLLQYFKLQCRSTAPPGNPNPVVFGEISIEHPAGTKLYTTDLVGNVAQLSGPHGLDLSIPWQIPAGGVLRAVCTPAAATSFLWRANFGGLLK